MEIQARAVWWLDQAELKSLGAAGNPAARFKAFQRLRNERNLPRHLLLAEGDNELPVDLDNPLMVEALWGTARDRESLLLVEDYPGIDQAVVTGPEGAFTHELVLSFLSEPEVPAAPMSAPAAIEHAARHAPGSSWLYAKLYSGQSTADQLLCNTLTPLIRGLLADGDIDRWFFLRFADPDPHLRLRFRGTPDQLWGPVLRRLHQTLDPHLKDDSLWGLQLDTYEPEVDRYGGPQVLPLAEQVFQADSEAAVAILEAYPRDVGADARWRLALASLDTFLVSAGLSVQERLGFAARQCRLYEQEFRTGSGPTRHQIGSKYRGEARALEAMLFQAVPLTDPLKPGLSVLAERSAKVSGFFEGMREQEAAGTLSRPLEDVLGSIVHMGVNRLLASVQRFQEMVLYDFAGRIYRSVLARTGYKAAAATSERPDGQQRLHGYQEV